MSCAPTLFSASRRGVPLHLRRRWPLPFLRWSRASSPHARRPTQSPIRSTSFATRATRQPCRSPATRMPPNTASIAARSDAWSRWRPRRRGSRCRSCIRRAVHCRGPRRQTYQSRLPPYLIDRERLRRARELVRHRRKLTTHACIWSPRHVESPFSGRCRLCEWCLALRVVARAACRCPGDTARFCTSRTWVRSSFAGGGTGFAGNQCHREAGDTTAAFVKAGAAHAAHAMSRVPRSSCTRDRRHPRDRPRRRAPPRRPRLRLKAAQAASATACRRSSRDFSCRRSPSA